MHIKQTHISTARPNLLKEHVFQKYRKKEAKNWQKGKITKAQLTMLGKSGEVQVWSGLVLCQIYLGLIENHTQSASFHIVTVKF